MHNSLSRIALACSVFVALNSASAQPTFRSIELLSRISGSKTIAGDHNREPNAHPAVYSDSVLSVTGKYPALWSGDFLFAAPDIEHRQTMIDQAKTQWDRGAMINLMFHACPPTQAEPCAWKGGVISALSDSQWTALVTDGTALNRNWKARLDVITPYLEQLRDQGVEVLFRPLHEMNQGAFWWGGRPGPAGTRRLFQLTHDYLVRDKKLTNLIWVWDLQDFASLATDVSAFDPGAKYWDVLALDMYSSDGNGYSSAKYDTMVQAAKRKPLVIGECQVLPTPELLATQPKWSLFMGWSELVFSNNSPDALKHLYQAANVITLEKMPGWGSPQLRGGHRSARSNKRRRARAQ